MKELLITLLYWLLNILIIFGALFYSFEVWKNKRKAIYGVLLFIGGILWHVGRGIHSYQNNLCEEFSPNDWWLIKANKCVPYMDYDVIWAQIAIFTGLFVIIAVVFQRYAAKS